MIILASSSPTRAQILREFGVEFTQISLEYDERKIQLQSPNNYVCNIASQKAKQFFAKFAGFDRVLFADSCVVARGQILGKAANSDIAKQMLNLQSGSETFIYTAMKFISKAYNIDMLSVASYKFSEFAKADLEEYIISNSWRGKAGAMSIEGFNKKYIIKASGNTYTAMGLDIVSLKAFL